MSMTSILMAIPSRPGFEYRNPPWTRIVQVSAFRFDVMTARLSRGPCPSSGATAASERVGSHGGRDSGYGRFGHASREMSQRSRSRRRRHHDGGHTMTMDRIISADSHVQEPSFLYEERVDVRYRARVPHTETRDDGEYRIVEGKRPRRLDVAESRLAEEDHEREFRHDRSGGRDLPVRLADQARDGVSGEVIYPNQSLFLYNSPDPDYQMAVARAYNDWAFELFGARPDRFVPVAILPVADVGAAVLEVTRAARLGYR